MIWYSPEPETDPSQPIQPLVFPPVQSSPRSPGDTVESPASTTEDDPSDDVWGDSQPKSAPQAVEILPRLLQLRPLSDFCPGVTSATPAFEAMMAVYDSDVEDDVVSVPASPRPDSPRDTTRNAAEAATPGSSPSAETPPPIEHHVSPTLTRASTPVPTVPSTPSAESPLPVDRYVSPTLTRASTPAPPAPSTTSDASSRPRRYTGIAAFARHLLEPEDEIRPDDPLRGHVDWEQEGGVEALVKGVMDRYARPRANAPTAPAEERVRVRCRKTLQQVDRKHWTAFITLVLNFLKIEVDYDLRGSYSVPKGAYRTRMWYMRQVHVVSDTFLPHLHYHLPSGWSLTE